MEEKKSTEVTGCNTCKKGLSKSQIGLIIFSMYIFSQETLEILFKPMSLLRIIEEDIFSAKGTLF